MKKTAFAHRGDSTGNDARLTEREKEVVKNIMTALPDKLIADRMQISTSTLNAHKRSIFEKYNVHSEKELIIKRL